MKFSVVIPLYNKSEHIIHTLESVLAQTMEDFEILVIDDGSSDDSLEMAQKVASPKIRIFQQKNQGVSVARNVGIENARGEYISFLDADDVWHADYLQTIDQLTKNYPQSDIYVTAYEVLMKDGKIIEQGNHEELLAANGFYANLTTATGRCTASNGYGQPP